ncbi:MAG TPA: DNA repair protein RecO [Pyrinomonadaceae bacterium]|jgi:DNA repair protein RecO (recombination protein O)|nr:DNA repair protein RecO [Pyrinomonadaceae bacterium]
MGLIETESLVIKSYNLAEADRIVVLLTQTQGVVRGVAKGAKRLNSKFGSGLEPFSVVQVTYFEKDSVELVSLQKVDLVRSNFDAAGNPDFLQKFAYLGDLLVTMSPPHDPNETLYRMVNACVETAAADPATLLSTGVYFELWMLRLAGYMPDWSRCDGCGRTFDDSEEANVQTNYHLMCLSCRRGSAPRPFGGISRSITAAARRLGPAEFANFTSDKHGELRSISIILKQMVSSAIGREIVGEKSLAINN